MELFDNKAIFGKIGEIVKEVVKIQPVTDSPQMGIIMGDVEYIHKEWTITVFEFGGIYKFISEALTEGIKAVPEGKELVHLGSKEILGDKRLLRTGYTNNNHAFALMCTLLGSNRVKLSLILSFATVIPIEQVAFDDNNFES